mgnify:CR=1 FL=1
MGKQIVNTGGKAFGPYSTAVWSGDTLFISGQIPFNADKGELDLSSIEAQTHQVMKNVAAVLSHVNLTWNDVVKASIFLTDMNDFSAVNEVYATYFDAERAPARECVQVAALPRGVNIEISVIAAKVTSIFNA